MIQRSTLLALTCLAALGGTPAAAQVSIAVTAEPSAIARLAMLGAVPSSGLAQLPPTPTPTNPPPAAPPTPSTPTTAPTLSNSEVLQLQLRLQQLGYYSQPVDGVYGADTEQALSAFQQDSGLPSTGSIDPITIQRLRTPQLFSTDTSPTSAAPAATPEIPNLLPTATESAAPAASTPASPESTATATASTPIAATTTDSAASTPRSPGGFSRLLFPALMLVGLGLVLGGVALVYRQLRSGQPQKPSPSDREAYDAADESALLSNEATVIDNLQNGAVTTSAAETTAALEETTRLPKVNIVETLVAELQSSDPAKRRQAIWELGQRGNSSAVQPLVNLIMDADSKERSLILAALSEIGTRTLKPMNRALALSLQDDNPEVRKNAIRDLTRIYDVAAQVSQMLSHVAEDDDPEVRETARWALGQLNRIRPAPSSESRPSLYDISPADFLPGERTNS
ncbi:peptidoglycan-binding protein [Almyronema epifaneia]|uniref:Peptidoglycan-binding protein n=1 Tax=Almyronema epifaneia S1 TaxID=2991925 RepID=A0ABW6ID47_9CYAN